MKTAIFRSLVVSTALWAMACGASSETVETTVAPVEAPGPQCLAGCFVSTSGACEIVARAMDGTTTVEERIECDPRCCQAGAKTAKGADPNDPDGDGIVGDQDQCPEQAEDRDEFEDKDGCPDLDNDKDGIPDTDDVCQDDPETKNGFEDDDGCPDVVAPPTEEEG